MHDYLIKAAERYEKLSLRERLMVLGAAGMLVYALLDVVWVSSLETRQRRTAQEVTQRQADLKALNDNFRAMDKQRVEDPDAVNRRKLAEMQERLAALDTQLRAQSRQLISPERMRGVLQKLLASRLRVQLVEMKTLPHMDVSPAPVGRNRSAANPPADTPRTAAPAQSVSSPGPGTTRTDADAAEGAGQIFRHGIEITLRGSYLDLLEYLRDIEGLPDRLYWDNLRVTVREFPSVTLNVTVVTMSMHKNWLQL